MTIKFRKSIAHTEERGELIVICRVAFDSRSSFQFEFPMRVVRECYHHVLHYSEACDRLSDFLAVTSGQSVDIFTELCRQYALTPTEIRNCCRGSTFREPRRRKGPWGGARRSERRSETISEEESDILAEAWENALREAVRCRSLAKFSIYASAWSSVYHRPWPPRCLEDEFSAQVLRIENDRG